jgi:hypothetical protein
MRSSSKLLSFVFLVSPQINFSPITSEKMSSDPGFIGLETLDGIKLLVLPTITENLDNPLPLSESTSEQLHAAAPDESRAIDGDERDYETVRFS